MPEKGRTAFNCLGVLVRFLFFISPSNGEGSRVSVERASIWTFSYVVFANDCGALFDDTNIKMDHERSEAVRCGDFSAIGGIGWIAVSVDSVPDVLSDGVYARKWEMGFWQEKKDGASAMHGDVLDIGGGNGDVERKSIGGRGYSSTANGRRLVNFCNNASDGSLCGGKNLGWKWYEDWSEKAGDLY